MNGTVLYQYFENIDLFVDILLDTSTKSFSNLIKIPYIDKIGKMNTMRDFVLFRRLSMLFVCGSLAELTPT